MYVFVYAPERFVKCARPTTFFFAPPACAGGRRNGIAISGSREEIRAGGGRVNNHASDHSQREQRNSKAGEVPGHEPGAAPEGAAEADVRLPAPETIPASQLPGELVSPTAFRRAARPRLASLQRAIHVH